MYVYYDEKYLNYHLPRVAWLSRTILLMVLSNRYHLWVCSTQCFWFQMYILLHLVLGRNIINFLAMSKPSFQLSLQWKIVISNYSLVHLILYVTRFHDYDDMLEDTWHIEYPRRPDISDGLFPGVNVGLPTWDSYPVLPSKPNKEEKVGLAEAITSSILSTGKMHIILPLSCFELFDNYMIWFYFDRSYRSQEKIVL